MWLRCAVTFLFAFILDLHTTKTLTMQYCAAFGCKHDSARYRELSFCIFPMEKFYSHVLKVIYQLMGQDPSKRR